MAAMAAPTQRMGMSTAAERAAFLAQHAERPPTSWPEGRPCKPSFLLIGAPKSGSTSLYQYLVHHPRVQPPAMKEMCYFSDFKRHLQHYRPNFFTTSWEVYTRQRMSKLEGNDWRLWLSCATSVFALAYGVAFTYLNEEGFVVRFLVCLYLFLFAVARFTMHAVIFVEFGAYGWYFTAYVFAVRVLVMVCRASRVGAGSKENVRAQSRSTSRLRCACFCWAHISCTVLISTCVAL